MGVKFLSFLGTGNYEPCKYEYEGQQSSNTHYFQYALLELLEKSDQRPTDVMIFLTQEAKNKNWDNGPAGSPGLASELEALRLTMHFNLQAVDILDMNNEASLWESFRKMFDLLEAGDQVVFDITHSFRFQPMLALLVLHFARVVKQVQVAGIYYGSYESRKDVPNEATHETEKVAPVLDLTPFADFQEWINNVDIFLKTGRSQPLAEWVNSTKKAITKEERSTSPDLKKVQGLSNKLDELTVALQTNRAPSISELSQKVVSAIDELRSTEVRHQFVLLNVLLSQIEESIRPLAKDAIDDSGFAAVEWCIRHGLVQQAYTLLDELILTIICEVEGIDKVKERELVNNVLRAAVKYVQNEGEFNDSDSKSRELAIRLAQHRTLLVLIHPLHDDRNDINHAAWRPSPKLAGHFEEKLLEVLPKIKEEVQKYYKIARLSSQ